MLALVPTGTDREALGLAVESHRLRANLKIEEALRRSGLSRTTWRNVEKARGAFPSQQVLHRMADALGIERAELLRLAGYNDSTPAPEPAALSGKIARLSDRDRRAVERLVDDMLGDE